MGEEAVEIDRVFRLRLPKLRGPMTVLVEKNGQWDLPREDALMNELRRGYATIESGEAAQGVLRFTGGSGRHGRFWPL
jgi:hypothetical protein